MEAEANEIDLKEIERWSRVQGKLGAFKRIRTQFVRREIEPSVAPDSR
jgi:hypothetical protein